MRIVGFLFCFLGILIAVLDVLTGHPWAAVLAGGCAGINFIIGIKG